MRRLSWLVVFIFWALGVCLFDIGLRVSSYVTITISFDLDSFDCLDCYVDV